MFVPYSTGSLIAYAKTQVEISEAFRFEQPHFLREDPVQVVRSLEQPTIAGFSCYLWNWEYNCQLAQGIKESFPECLVVFGGTHVPDASEGFFEKHPYVDLLVHQEGEFAFADIMRESLAREPDYTKVPGLTVRVEGVRSFKTPKRPRITDLSKLPSPYLAGVFDFMLGMGYTLNASQETDRGCPYQCTFCDWGGATYNKVTQIPEERIYDELEWFGRNKVEYIFNCNANYGLFPRDHEITRKMIEIRAKHGGYPGKFRMCTAKNSNDKIFQIVKMLSDAGMNKGATLSFQSMDDTTLEIVKRKNIKITDFSGLMNQYKEAGIATYTELIMGMPGETYESTKQGIDTLLDAQAESVNIYVYPCTMLPNSEMSNPEYVKKHGIEAVRMPVLLAHSTPDPNSIGEYTDVVVGTHTMPKEAWVRTFMFYWAVQCFHCLGLTPQIAMLLRREFDVTYSTFYERLIEYFAARPTTLIGQEIAVTRKLVEDSLNGGRLDRVLPEFGEIYWPLEEASFLGFVTHKKRFYYELTELLHDTAPLVNQDLVRDLERYQSALVIDPDRCMFAESLVHDLHRYFETGSLVRHTNAVIINAARSYVDIKEYARELVWYGRKGGKFHHANIAVERV